MAYVVAVPYFVGACRAADTPPNRSPRSPTAWRRRRGIAFAGDTGRNVHSKARFAAVRVPVPKSCSVRWLLCRESLVDSERQYYVSHLLPKTRR